MHASRSPEECIDIGPGLAKRCYAQGQLDDNQRMLVECAGGGAAGRSVCTTVEAAPIAITELRAPACMRALLVARHVLAPVAVRWDASRMRAGWSSALEDQLRAPCLRDSCSPCRPWLCWAYPRQHTPRPVRHTAGIFPSCVIDVKLKSKLCQRMTD